MTYGYTEQRIFGATERGKTQLIGASSLYSKDSRKCSCYGYCKKLKYIKEVKILLTFGVGNISPYLGLLGQYTPCTHSSFTDREEQKQFAAFPFVTTKIFAFRLADDNTPPKVT